ncbi:MAG TPA: hypothetical protein VMV50_01135 [Candidatus Paceibacterota bacterium]|nr:hypothetical protein [Candidatus Paceibacterota bacterium]
MKYAYVAIGVVIVGLLGWTVVSQASDPTIVATHGLHWHSHLFITVKGQNVTIPAGIGLGAAEMPIHTHDDTGTIHMEFPGVVHASDLTLAQFFKVWGKDMSSFGSNMQMIVNGATSTAYGSYVMHDGDTIELSYD